MSCLPEENHKKTLSVSQLAFKKKDNKVHSLPCFEPFDISASNKFDDYEMRFSQRDDEIALQKAFEVNTKYKPKSERYLPVKKLNESGEGPGGGFNWKSEILKKIDLKKAKQDHKGKYKDLIIPRITKIARGARLSEERIQTYWRGFDS